MSTSNRTLYDEIMSKRLGISRHGEDKDRLEVTLKTLAQLRGTGLIDDPRDAGKGDDLRELLRDWGPLVGQIIRGMSGGQAAQQQFVVPQQVAAPNPQPQSAGVIDAAKSEVPEQQPSSQPAPSAQAQQQPSQASQSATAEQSPISSYLISQFNGVTPEQAAMWILAQAQSQSPQREAFAWLVGEINRLPDQAMPMFLTTWGEDRNGQLRGFTDWLLDNTSWTLATVHEVRRLSAAAPAAVAES